MTEPDSGAVRYCSRFSLTFSGRDGYDPEEGADGPVEPHPVFQHARVALQPGDHGGEIGFTQERAERSVDGIVEHDRGALCGFGVV